MSKTIFLSLKDDYRNAYEADFQKQFPILGIMNIIILSRRVSICLARDDVHFARFVKVFTTKYVLDYLLGLKRVLAQIDTLEMLTHY